MRRQIICFIIALFLISSCSEKGPAVVPSPYSTPEEAGEFSADNPNIAYYGRWDFTDTKNPVTDWGCVYVRTGFQGPSIAVKFEDEGNFFQYSIDNGPFKVFNGQNGTLHKLETDLADTSHQLLLVRRSSCTYGRTVFTGFTLKPGKYLTPPLPPAARKIELIGDSLSIGFENEITTGEKFGDLETENGYMAFGPQAARILNADYRVIGKKALGVARNLLENAGGSQRKIKDYYGGLLSDGNTPWNFSSWVPDAIVIAAGAVDYLTMLDIYTLPSQQQYETAYKALIAYVREKNPGVPIMCLVYRVGQSADYTRNAVNAMIPGDSNLYMIDALLPLPWITDPLDFIPEGLHLNVSGHTKMGAKLAEAVSGILGW